MIRPFRALSLTAKFTLLLLAFLAMQSLQLGLVLYELDHVHEESEELSRAATMHRTALLLAALMHDAANRGDWPPGQRRQFETILAEHRTSREESHAALERQPSAEAVHAEFRRQQQEALAEWTRDMQPLLVAFDPRRPDAATVAERFGRMAAAQAQRFEPNAVGLEADMRADLREMTWVLAVLLVLSMLLGTGGYFMARRIVVAPLGRLTRAAAMIAAGAYDRRVPDDSRDELGELAASFNRMAEAVSRQTENLTALNEVAVGLASSLDLEAVLHQVMRRGVALSGAHAAAIALYPGEGGREAGGAVQWVVHGLPPGAGAGEDLVSPEAVTETMGGHAPVLCNNQFNSRHRLNRALSEAGFRAGLCLPVRSLRSALGLFCIYRRDRDHFLPGEVALLTTFVSLVAGAIENARLHARARRQAVTDELTGLANRRHLDQRLGEEIVRAQRYAKPLSLLILDIDHFKAINDGYGHKAGDEALRALAQVLRGEVRDVDLVARYGGEEFVLVLPETDGTGAELSAERIRRAVARHPFRLPDGREFGITVSVGLAGYPECAASAAELMTRADQALYTAKQAGRNRVVLYRDLLKSELEQNPGRIADLLNLSLGNGQAIAVAVDLKSTFMRNHSLHAQDYARRLGRSLGLATAEMNTLAFAALLHDIGTITISDDLFNKCGALNEEEWQVIRRHPTAAVEILAAVPALRAALPAIRHHHERYDGSGYPDGLQGEAIPYLARILQVVDGYCAMTSDRPQRRALSADEAQAALRAGAGTQFDPDLVAAFIKMLEDERTG
jgi:diguanylate cyclase (GGDEF)-like protein